MDEPIEITLQNRKIRLNCVQLRMVGDGCAEAHGEGLVTLHEAECLRVAHLDGQKFEVDAGKNGSSAVAMFETVRFPTRDHGTIGAFARVSIKAMQWQNRCADVKVPVWPSTADTKADRERGYAQEYMQQPIPVTAKALAMSSIKAISMFQPIHITPETCGVQRPSAAKHNAVTALRLSVPTDTVEIDPHPPGHFAVRWNGAVVKWPGDCASKASDESDEQLMARVRGCLTTADPAALLRAIDEANGSGLDYIGGELLGDRRKAGVSLDTTGLDRNNERIVGTYTGIESDAGYRERLIDRVCTCRGGMHVLGRDPGTWTTCQCRAVPIGRHDHDLDPVKAQSGEVMAVRPQQVCHFCERWPGNLKLTEYSAHAWGFVRGEYYELFYACSEAACPAAARNRCDNSRLEYEARKAARKESIKALPAQQFRYGYEVEPQRLTPPLRPDGFSQHQVDAAKAMLLSTKRGAK